MAAITDEIQRFEMMGKVVSIVADNGSNIKKAVLTMQQEAQEKENVRRTERQNEKSKRAAENEKSAKVANPAKKRKSTGISKTSIR